MYDYAGTPSRNAATTEQRDDHARLNYLLSLNAREAHRLRLFRSAQEEEQMLLMRRPLSARKSYARFGMLLGLLPPASIFVRIFGYGMSGVSHNDNILLVFCILMNLICAATGYGTGAMLSGPAERLERASWTRMMLTMPLIGAGWGALTGGAGGFIFFGFGALIGLLCAIPVGVAAFLLFATLHRLLACGGMIDARHFWPLACGVTTVIAALILRM